MEIVEFRKRRTTKGRRERYGHSYIQEGVGISWRWWWLWRWWSPQTFKSSCVTEGLISTAQASQKMRRRTQDEVHNKPAIYILEKEINRQYIKKRATQQCRLAPSLYNKEVPGMVREPESVWILSGYFAFFPLSKKICIWGASTGANVCLFPYDPVMNWRTGWNPSVVTHKTNRIRSSYLHDPECKQSIDRKGMDDVKSLFLDCLNWANHTISW